MDFDDFPKILGNLGVETDHPPKMCAGLVRGRHPSSERGRRSSSAAPERRSRLGEFATQRSKPARNFSEHRGTTWTDFLGHGEVFW